MAATDVDWAWPLFGLSDEESVWPTDMKPQGDGPGRLDLVVSALAAVEPGGASTVDARGDSESARFVGRGWPAGGSVPLQGEPGEDPKSSSSPPATHTFETSRLPPREYKCSKRVRDGSGRTDADCQSRLVARTEADHCRLSMATLRQFRHLLSRARGRRVSEQTTRLGRHRRNPESRGDGQELGRLRQSALGGNARRGSNASPQQSGTRYLGHAPGRSDAEGCPGLLERVEADQLRLSMATLHQLGHLLPGDYGGNPAERAARLN